MEGPRALCTQWRLFLYMNHFTHTKIAVAFGLALFLGGCSVVSAESIDTQKNQDFRPVVMGVVSARTGTMLTVTSKDGALYTIDAAQALITKSLGRESSVNSVSDIPLGETVVVAGVLSDTTVTATRVIYGLGGALLKGGPGVVGDSIATAASLEAPRPIAVGVVTTIAGTTITLESTDSGTVTVDASDAMFLKTGDKATSIAGIAVGDTVSVEGVGTGAALSATKVVDTTKAPPTRKQDKKSSEKIEAASPAVKRAEVQQASFFKKVGSLLGHLKFW